jgi:transcriptional regulator NrdR family protein
MRCPKCGKGTMVLETRSTSLSNYSYKRRRACTDASRCGHRFSTVEQVVGTVAQLVTSVLDRAGLDRIPAGHDLEPEVAAAIYNTEQRRARIIAEQQERDAEDGNPDIHETRLALRGY